MKNGSIPNIKLKVWHYATDFRTCVLRDDFFSISLIKILRDEQCPIRLSFVSVEMPQFP